MECPQRRQLLKQHVLVCADRGCLKKNGVAIASRGCFIVGVFRELGGPADLYMGSVAAQEVTNRRPCKHVRCNASDKVDVIKAEQPNSSHTASKPTNQQTSKTVNIGFYSREGV